MTAKKPKTEILARGTVIRAIRNVLFNELGLSRKQIDDFVRAEVHGGWERYYRDQDQVDNFVTNAIARAIRRFYGTATVENMIKQIVQQEAQKYIREIVDSMLKDRLEININANVRSKP